MKTIIILAGGASCAEYDLTNLKDYGYVIGVNDAAKYVKCNHALSMDRLWVENRTPDIISWGIPIHIREGMSKTPYPFSWTSFKWGENTRSPRSRILTDRIGILNGQNSGMCAVNLAYQMKPKRIYLLGFDMTKTNGKSYWYPSYSWANDIALSKYKRWSEDFKEVGKQCAEKDIKVINVTHNSLINTLPRISFEQFLKDAKCFNSAE